jgi:crotonobetainyl-CoA:carnitine CoA-transferase CaiB-like acyl-CoA transferase
MPGGGGVNFMMEQSNRGKQSVAIDLSKAEGRELLYRLVADADVFLTSFLPEARRKLAIDVEDIRKHNPDIIYVRGSGQGSRGPEVDRGGYDAASFWARGGIADILTASEASTSMPPPGPAFGDSAGAVNVAGGIAAALFRRERTGEASVVDVSLLGTAMWLMSASIAMTSSLGFALKVGNIDRTQPMNPLVNAYPTKDARWIFLNILTSDRDWPDFCQHLGREDLIADPRFADSARRVENKTECVAVLDAIFTSATLDEWKQRLATMKGVWAPVQTTTELPIDPMAIANGYTTSLESEAGKSYTLVASPVQFDETPPTLGKSPNHGQHTDEVLQTLGLTMDQLLELKAKGAIL